MNDLGIVTNTAHALVYKGLDKNTALQLVALLSENQRTLLIFTLVKMIGKFNGRK